MKNKFKAIFMSILLIFSVIIPSLANVKPVSAADTIPDSVNITLHKRVFEDGQTPNNKPNTGEIMPDFGGVALPNVGFTVYDITSEYINDLKVENATAETVTSALVEKYKTTAPTTEVVAGESKTDKSGNVTFSGLATKDGENFKTYLILETTTPTAIKEKSAPIVLTMPIYGSDATTALTDIHVYPKNSENKDNYAGKLTKKLVSSITNSIAWSGVNAENTVWSPRIGRLLEYNVTYDVPATTIFDNNSGIVIVDDPGLGIVIPEKVATDGNGNVLDTIVDVHNADTSTTRANVEVFDKDGNRLSDDKIKVEYEGVNGNNSKFTLTIQGSQNADLAGEQLTIKYHAYLGRKDNSMDNPIDNKVTATADTTHGTEGSANAPTNNTLVSEIAAEKHLAVGGINFKKVDAQSNKALKGAEFVVKNENGQFLKVIKSEGENAREAHQFVDSQNDATIFTSDENGKFTVDYIPYGNYSLVETKAPEGYAVGKDFEFTIEKDTHSATVDSHTEVKNAKKGLLPSTGGYGIYIFLVLGLALMGGAYAWFRRTRKNENV